jgi:hypothetical protein
MTIRALTSTLVIPVLLLLAASAPVSAQSSAQTPAAPHTRPRTVAPEPSPATPQQQVTPVPAVTPAPTPVIALPPVSTVMLQPARPMPANKVRARINEAQRLLKTRLVPTALTPSIYLVTVAALDPDSSQIHLLTLPKQTFLTQNAEVTLATSLGTNVRLRVVRSNYVNTAVIISDLLGRQFSPLVVEYPIEKGGAFREMAYYTSAHPALLSPELVKTGQAYVHTMLDLAAKRLRDKGVRIAPQIIDVAERLCVVEHVDHGRFRNESRQALFDEVYALFALNELDTYRYSVSWAGAGGMVQMIPSTYQMVRQRHPGVGLNPDFVFGMRNHGNALEAMLLYMQDTWNDLALNLDINYALSAGLATQAELLSAGYNSNPARLPLYIRRGGSAWRTLIPRETQMYLQIYRSVESLVPMKPREGVAGQEHRDAPQAARAFSLRILFAAPLFFMIGG